MTHHSLGVGPRFARFLSLLLALAIVVRPVVAADPPAADEKIDGLKEQTIYIPYSKLRQIFETEKRGVFLPYDKFQELWKAAREKGPAAPEIKPPVGALINEITNEAVISRDVVKVAATVQIELLSDGWHSIPLRLNDAAITSAKIDDKPARILFDKDAGYRLLVERSKDGPKQLELKIEYAKTFTKQPGANSVSFQSPQAPVSRWKVHIDEPGVKIDIKPLIAAGDVASTDAKAKHSEILAFVGAADSVQIDWTPRAEGAAGLDVLAFVQNEQQVFVEETVVRTRAALSYSISRAELKQLEIEVPAAHRVANVYDANVRRWTLAKPEADKPDVQRIVVELFEPAKQSQNVVVELEQIGKEAATQTTTVPVVSAVGVARQQGVVVVQVAEGLRVEAAKRSGLLQVDSTELPASLQRGKWTFAYRYSTVPFELTLNVEKVQPRITGDLLVEATLQPDQLTLNVKARYLIERAGIFRLELEIPPGFEIREARGRSCDGVEAVSVDTYRVEGEQKNRLIVNLARRALGTVGLGVQLVKPLTDAELRTPLGRAASIVLPLPRIAPGTAERSTGRLLVYAPESLRVNPGASQGLRAVSFDEAVAGMEGLRETSLSGVRPVQAFAYADAAAQLTLEAERRKPQITVRQMLTARVEPGVVKYEATFFYEILYSGVKSLRIDLPATLATRIHNDTPRVRETVMAPPPDDLKEGDIAWSLAGESEFLGNTVIKLSWETPLEKLDVGASVDVEPPHLKPRNVDRAWGQIALVKAEAIDLREKSEAEGVRPIDPQRDLMPGANVAGAARAFEFYGDWKLAVTAVRYQLEEVKRTSIERAVIRAVATRSRQTSVQALYQLRSARQRLTLHLPPGAKFDSEPLRINGKSAAVESGNENEYFVPLVGQDPDTPFLLEIRYALANHGTTFDLPEFKDGVDGPAIQKVYLCAYVPDELAVGAATGPWTDEYIWSWGHTEWRYSGGEGFVPVPIRSDAELISWVTQGVPAASNPFDSFQKDGRLFVFSAVRPDPAPNGSLTLSIVHRTALNWIVLLAFVGGALALARKPVAVGATAVGAAIAALVLLGVFQPMLMHEIVNSVFIWGATLVLVVWIAAFFLRRRSRRAATPPDAAVAPPPASTEPPPANDVTTPPDGPAPGGEHHG